MTLPPGPKTPSWLLNQQFQADPFGYMDAICKRFGDIVTIMSGSTPTVHVGNPSGIKQIFTNDKEITASGALNQRSAFTTGNQGILQLDGLRHKHRRKLLMKAYHGERMYACGQRICVNTEKIMSQQAIGKTFIAYDTVLEITLQVGIELVMGLREGEGYEKIKHLFTSFVKHDLSPLVRMTSQLPFGQRDLGRWSPWGYRNHLRNEIFQLLYNEVQERRQQANPSHTDMLSDLIFACDETGKALSDEEVRDLLVLPILATRDGAAHSIAWSLYWIHRLPGIRKRLLEELDSLGKDPDPMSIVALPYLSAVCNEVLRIYPSAVFMIPRLVELPVKVMGYELSPGTVLIGNIYLTHQREDLYPDPKQFKPERFLEKQFSPYEFLPFGGGARSCIAGTFGQFQMKLVLATILLRYQLALVNKRPERPKMFSDQCHPASGVKMVMHGRRQHQGRLQPSVVGSV
ncbi:cytochrome P450 [Scytonema hofmannii PCC 7110]|uniref:Cytochrome P450 n=1 Tax=Scytonema hofmannii PCC 7110 TaxID=128403 RepID=A0A139WVX7_9CYAN|nr:cytochrome P450 [Scytonema hofmannii]KYC36585.1 cytochrome P450 [Scytonema hofmannii PCC 7110]